MPNKLKNRFVPIIILVLLSLSGTIYAADEIVVLQVQGPSRGFTDLHLEDKLYYLFSGVEGLTMAWKPDVENWLEQKNYQDQLLYSPEIQRELGDRFKADYLVWIRIDRADTGIKSSTLVPFVFKSHKRKFVYKVDLRFIDTQQGSLLKNKSISESKNGSRSVAYLDLDAGSQPALASTYTIEMEAFEELENKVADKIIKNLSRRIISADSNPAIR